MLNVHVQHSGFVKCCTVRTRPRLVSVQATHLVVVSGDDLTGAREQGARDVDGAARIDAAQMTRRQLPHLRRPLGGMQMLLDTCMRLSEQIGAGASMKAGVAAILQLVSLIRDSVEPKRVLRAILCQRQAYITTGWTAYGGSWHVASLVRRSILPHGR